MVTKSFLKFALLTIIVGTFFGCDKDIANSKAPNTFDLYVKFVSPSGTDILDSIYGEVTERPFYISSNDFHAECYKDDTFFENIYNEEIDNYEWTIGDGKKMNGTLLTLGWIEWLNNESSNLTYTIKMQSKKIYGDEETHYIKLYLQKKDRLNVNIYKIEADGNEISYTGIYKDSIATIYAPDFQAYMEICINKTDNEEQGNLP